MNTNLEFALRRMLQSGEPLSIWNERARKAKESRMTPEELAAAHERNRYPTEEEIVRVLAEGTLQQVGDLLIRTGCSEPRIARRFRELTRAARRIT